MLFGDFKCTSKFNEKDKSFEIESSAGKIALKDIKVKSIETNLTSENLKINNENLIKTISYTLIIEDYNDKVGKKIQTFEIEDSDTFCYFYRFAKEIDLTFSKEAKKKYKQENFVWFNNRNKPKKDMVEDFVDLRIWSGQKNIYVDASFEAIDKNLEFKDSYNAVTFMAINKEDFDTLREEISKLFKYLMDEENKEFS